MYLNIKILVFLKHNNQKWVSFPFWDLSLVGSIWKAFYVSFIMFVHVFFSRKSKSEMLLVAVMKHPHTYIVREKALFWPTGQGFSSSLGKSR